MPDDKRPPRDWVQTREPTRAAVPIAEHVHRLVVVLIAALTSAAVALSGPAYSPPPTQPPHRTKESAINLNPPRPVRALLYLSATFATPTVSYLAATGKISDALTVLLTAYIALVMALATANTASEPPPAE